jgi:hypothetical protein
LALDAGQDHSRLTPFFEFFLQRDEERVGGENPLLRESGRALELGA